MTMMIRSIFFVLFCWFSHTLHAQCPAGWWQCGNKRCIVIGRRCNGWDSCKDGGSDERNCAQWTCPGGGEWWQCDDQQCIPTPRRCSGDRRGAEDCQDGSDEKNCEWWTCPEEGRWWQCQNQQCVATSQRCDGHTDCADRTDEKHCDRLYDDHLTIGPSHVVIRDAQKEVTLTCNVSDVYSKPDFFVWSVGACRNRSAGNTCTFTLGAVSDASPNVTCTALRINGRNEVVASGSKTMRLNVTALVGETPLQSKVLERSGVVSGIVLLVVVIAVVIAVVVTRRRYFRKRRRTTESTSGSRSSGWYEEVQELPEIQREQFPSPRATDTPAYIVHPLPVAVDPTHPLPHSPDHLKDRLLPALPGFAVQAAARAITEQRHPPWSHAEGGSLPYAAMSVASCLPHLPRHNTAERLQSTTTFLGTTRPRWNAYTPIQLRTITPATEGYERYWYTPLKTPSFYQRLESHLAAAYPDLAADNDLDLCPIFTLPSRGSDTVNDYLELLPDDALVTSSSRDYTEPLSCIYRDCQGSHSEEYLFAKNIDDYLYAKDTGDYLCPTGWSRVRIM